MLGWIALEIYFLVIVTWFVDEYYAIGDNSDQLHKMQTKLLKENLIQHSNDTRQPEDEDPFSAGYKSRNDYQKA